MYIMFHVMYVLYFMYWPLAAELVGPRHGLWPVCARAQTCLCVVYVGCHKAELAK